MFGRLCNSLRTQARYTARTMPPAARERVGASTEHLIAKLGDGNQRYLFCEGAERDIAVRDLSWLVSDALRRSCRPRTQRDGLLIADVAILAEVPEPDAVSVVEPLRNRLLAGAGRMALAVGLLTGAALFPGGGAVSDLLAAAGLASVALICPPLREALHRARDLLVSSSINDNRLTETTDEDLGPERSSSATPAPTAPTTRPSPQEHGSAGR